MEIGALIEIALANGDRRQIAVTSLEPVEIAIEAVGGLVQIVSELVENALNFSAPGDRVTVRGETAEEGYVISISDHGVGIPPDLVDGLNRVLSESGRVSGPDPNLGIALVSRLARRHRIGIRLVSEASGTSARVSVPTRLVSRITASDSSESERRLPPRPDLSVFASSEASETLDLTLFEGSQSAGGVVGMSDDARREAERFLERVFGPLRNRPATGQTAPARPGSNGKTPPRDRPQTADRPGGEPAGATVTTLRVREPGKNFNMVEDNPSTVAAEGAIDIRSALTRFADGRRSAERERRRD